MKTRFIQRIGTRVSLRVFCYSSDHKCSAHGYGCDVKVHIKDVLHTIEEGKEENEFGWVFKHWGGEEKDYQESQWPARCEHCNELFDGKKAKRQVFNEKLYNTQSGRPEPGDLYHNDWMPENSYWDNHTGPHLMAVCPNGQEWNIDSRASNCDMPNERTHRCWVRHGSPQDGTIHIDKQGHTCGAGAGSIAVPGYHGFLHNGEFTNG